MKKTLKKLTVIFGITVMLIGGLCSCESKYEKQEKENKEILSEIEVKLADGDYSGAREKAQKLNWGSDVAMSKIARQEISYLINSQGEDAAFRVAQEQGMTPIFYESYMPKLIDLYEKNGLQKMIIYLSKVQFKNSPNLDEGINDFGSGEANLEYNKEVNDYNQFLEQFITYLEVMNKREDAKSVLKFVKPILVQPKNEYRCEFSDEPMKAIKAKLNL